MMKKVLAIGMIAAFLTSAALASARAGVRAAHSNGLKCRTLLADDFL